MVLVYSDHVLMSTVWMRSSYREDKLARSPGERDRPAQDQGTGQDTGPPAVITVTLDRDLLSPEQMRLAESLAESLIQETTGMRPQVSEDGDGVTFTPAESSRDNPGATRSGISR
jgi:hypothetical protein